MKVTKAIIVIIAVLALGALGYNFYDNPKVSYLFGSEINVWLYRAFWLLIVGLCVYYYIYINQNTLKHKSKSKYR